jgi:hypothetical protein
MAGSPKIFSKCVNRILAASVFSELAGHKGSMCGYFERCSRSTVLCDNTDFPSTMVDFEYWFDGVVSTCEFIADEGVFRKVWIDGDHTITSIRYYDELYVQLRDDLLFDTNLREFTSTIRDELTTRTLAVFSDSLETLNRSIEANTQLNDPATLLSSPEWATFRKSARQVIELPYSQPYREGRKTREIVQRLQRNRSA